MPVDLPLVVVAIASEVVVVDCCFVADTQLRALQVPRPVRLTVSLLGSHCAGQLRCCGKPNNNNDGLYQDFEIGIRITTRVGVAADMLPSHSSPCSAVICICAMAR